MPLPIIAVEEGSAALRAGVRAGEPLLSINGQPVDDFLDLQYHAAEEELRLELLGADGERRTVMLRRDWTTPLGIQPAPHRCRTCVNNCVFCFVDQMRPGTRPSLNIKDDDPAFSFFFGNFITLSNLGRGDWRRILSQHRSPLYVSVHTTDPDLHRRLVRCRLAFDVMDALRRLEAGDIELHTQIVVAPGWNDGDALSRTLEDLLGLQNVLTVGIVPVGLTRFREGLTPLRRVDAAGAADMLRRAGAANVGLPEPRVFCSDEIYLLAGADIPPDEHYGDYVQIENGIGMVRTMWENWRVNAADYIAQLREHGGRFVFVTGALAAPVLAPVAGEIADALGKDTVRVQAVRNDYLGESVTVAGLLAAQDICAQVRLAPDETALLPSCIFNTDGITLDDVRREDLPLRFLETDSLFDL